MARNSTRNRIIVGVIVVAALFYVAMPMLMPEPDTGSDNARFNDWVAYYRRQDGYTVEYRSFEDFKEEVDVVKAMQALEMSEDVVDFKEAAGTVTVYYDGESENIFFVGTGADASKTYGYFCSF